MPVERSNGLSIAERVHHRLRDDIMGGELAPGTQLVEVDLAAAYGASRNTIREVLHQLGREGLATFVRHRGVVVRRMEPKDLRDLYAARRALELRAVSGDLPLQPALLAKMLSAIQAAEAALARGKWRDVGTLSLQVHQHIVALLGSRLLDEFFRTLCAQLRLVFACEPDESRIQTANWIEREYQIYQFLAADRCQEASRALAAYLDDSERTLTGVLVRLKNAQAK